MRQTRRWLVRRAGVAAIGGAAVALSADQAAAADSGAAEFPALGVGTAPLGAGVQVAGSQSGALATIEQQATNGHALALVLAAAGGASQAALNAVSDNSAGSAAEITGCETGHGTLKVTHLGYPDGSDANAAAVSIDLQTAGATTGTRAQGIFITSTTDTAPGGNAVNIRYHGLDWFVVKGGNSAAGQGVVGIGVPIGHVPTGMLEIDQKDASTSALFLRGPNGGPGMALYLDDEGNLMARTAAGNVRTVVPV